MPTVTLNGIQIYYEIHGRGDPLVLIMGLRRNAEWWQYQIPTLSQSFQVVVFDNRGAGRSDKPDMPYSIGLFAEDTKELMSSLGIRRAHVLGVSMGGYIAQELAILYPEMVRGLILGCTSPGGKRAVAMSPERLAMFTAIQGLSPEQILRKDMDIYFSQHFIDTNPDWINRFIEISLRYYQPVEAFQHQFEACLTHDTTDRLQTIHRPTLILSGDDDPLVPPENSRILKECIPQAELVFFPNGRHCFFIEEAELFNKKVLAFLKGIKD
jgi:pimeloyl-ACP methyl ester carboxylesterase